jgi:hypothetical protein
MSCPYKHIFGIPGQGVHSTRIGGIALVDTIGTIVLAGGTSYLTNTSLFWNIAGWFVIGEFLHWYFGTQTAFLNLIGVSTNC